ncbi:MAG: competence/damage-inducible protein A [Acidobacteriota bacterium]
MRAEILTVGTELLTPGRVDTNSAYLTEQLLSVGIPVLFRATVGDDRRLIAEAARQALARAELVLATGGLGPTSDDVTREGFSDALELPLTFDDGILEGIRRRFERRGIAMPPVNRKQAMVLRGAQVLANDVGTAPGLRVTLPNSGRAGGAKHVVLLPGPPPELRSVFEKHVLPWLAKSARGGVYRTRRLLVAGITESAVEQRIGDIYRECRNPTTTILASPGQVEVRLTGRGESREDAEKAIEALASRLRQVLGRHLFSESGASLEEVLGRLLAEKGLTLAVAESCTGGLITHRLTDVPGSSVYLERGFVAYSNESKVQLLDVPESLLRQFGAVSEEVAGAMAVGARQRAGTDWALAVTGIAGPGGGSPAKPVGLVYVALTDGQSHVTRRFQFPGDRWQVKWWTSQAAMNLLRLRIAFGSEPEG